MSGGADGIGSITWWGFSSAVDLAALAPRPGESAEDEEGAGLEGRNILVVGSGDLRHVLMTLANSAEPLHFYVAESSLELLARHMLFLTLVSEPLDQLGIQERSELFLELYGNTLVRHHTYQWLSEKANQLIRMVTDLDYQKKVLPILDLSLLKFKERDMLEGIFKFWRHQDPATFDISKHWEGRVRNHLGTRYDSRSGVFDWDYHMKLHEMAEIVSSSEYLGWRESGIAFQLRDDAPYEYSNRTLASGLITMKGGERVARRGYWGDIVNSPYLTLGLESENKDLFRKGNTKHMKGSVDVSVWNTQWLLGRLIGVEPSRAAVGEKLPSIQEVDDEGEEETQIEKDKPLHQGCCITFLPLNSVQDLSKKVRFKGLFDIAYFSNSMVHHLTSGVDASFAQHSVILLETTRFMLQLKKEQKLEYAKKVTSMANNIGYTTELHDSTKLEDLNLLAFTRAKTS